MAKLFSFIFVVYLLYVWSAEIRADDKRHQSKDKSTDALSNENDFNTRQGIDEYIESILGYKNETSTLFVMKEALRCPNEIYYCLNKCPSGCDKLYFGCYIGTKICIEACCCKSNKKMKTCSLMS